MSYTPRSRPRGARAPRKSETGRSSQDDSSTGPSDTTSGTFSSTKIFSSHVVGEGRLRDEAILHHAGPQHMFPSTQSNESEAREPNQNHSSRALKPLFLPAARARLATANSISTFNDFSDSTETSQASLPYVTSPIESAGSFSRVSVASTPPLPALTSPTHTLFSSPPSSISDLPNVSGKTPRNRWAQIREHVRTSDPPLRSPAPVPEAVEQVPSRSSTPTPSLFSVAQQVQQKSSRLARFGFRHNASEHTQNFANNSDITKQFESDIRKACRSIKQAAAGVGDGVGVATAPPPGLVQGHVPFGGGGAPPSMAMGGFASKLGRGLRRPPSSSSLHTLASEKGKAAPVPPPGRESSSGPYQLLNVLNYYASIPNPTTLLPIESMVLSILIQPFLTQDRSEDQLEEARTTSLAAFNTIVSTWKSQNPEVRTVFVRIFQEG